MLRMLRLILATVVTVAVAALAVPAPAPIPLLGDLLPPLTSIILPTRDSFYDAPANLASYAVGTVIRSRQVSTQTMASKAYQVLYRTTDQLGQPQYGITTTLIPRNGQSPPRLVSYQAFEDSTALDCATSFAILPNTTSKNSDLGTSTNPVANILLSFGYTVTVPDFLGPKSAFIVGKQQGQAVLDAVRATLNHPQTIANKNNVRAALMGYSGGASATAWAAQLQPSYAKELDFVGATYGGLPVSPANILTKVDGGPNSGLGLAGIIGMANAYPALDSFVKSRLNDRGRAMLTALRSGQVCLAQLSSAFANTKISNFFNGFTLSEAPVPQILQENTLGGAITQMPQYIFQGLRDEIMPVPDVDNYVTSQCKGGARINYSRDRNATHTGEIGSSVVGALTWVDGRFSGLFPVPNPGQCIVKTQDVNQGPPLSSNAASAAAAASVKPLSSKGTKDASRLAAGYVAPEAAAVNPALASAAEDIFGEQGIAIFKQSLPWA